MNITPGPADYNALKSAFEGEENRKMVIMENKPTVPLNKPPDSSIEEEEEE